MLLGLVGRLGELDAAGLAATACLHLGLDDDDAASCSAAALASSGVVATMPFVTGTSCLAKSSFAWYSIRSTVFAPVFSSG